MQNDGEITKKLNEFFKNDVSTVGITEKPFIISKEYENIVNGNNHKLKPLSYWIQDETPKFEKSNNTQ